MLEETRNSERVDKASREGVKEKRGRERERERERERGRVEIEQRTESVPF